MQLCEISTAGQLSLLGLVEGGKQTGGGGGGDGGGGGGEEKEEGVVARTAIREHVCVAIC